MNAKLYKVQGLLFVLLAFFIPISIFVTDILIFSISLLWILQGQFKNKWKIIRSSKWMISIIALLGLYIFGLLWGEFHSNALWTLEKTALLLFLPILWHWSKTR